MQLVHRIDGDILIVEVLEARLATDVAKSFGERLAHLIGLGHRRVVLNLSRVRFIDSSGLGVIVMVQRRLLDGGEMVIAAAQEPVLNMLKLTRMNKIFRIFPDESEAVAALAETAGGEQKDSPAET